MRTRCLAAAFLLAGCLPGLQFRPSMSEELKGAPLKQELLSSDGQIKVSRIEEANDHKGWRTCNKHQLLISYAPNQAGGLTGDIGEELDVGIYCGDTTHDENWEATFKCKYNPLELLVASDQPLKLTSKSPPKREDYIMHYALLEAAPGSTISYHLPSCYAKEE